MLDFNRFEVMTFDCYGTLIDWETGIITSLRSLLGARASGLDDEELLELYANLETTAESGTFVDYKTVLRRVFRGFEDHLGFTPREEECRRFVYSLKDWPPFPDTSEALRALQKHFKIAVISNVDNNLFEYSQKLMDIHFDWVITAEEVRSYKPSLRNFEYALKTMGLPKEKMLHVAQSHFHDIIPASSLGIATVWINRRAGRKGSGATSPAQGTPDLEVRDLQSLAAMIE